MIHKSTKNLHRINRLQRHIMTHATGKIMANVTFRYFASHTAWNAREQGHNNTEHGHNNIEIQHPQQGRHKTNDMAQGRPPSRALGRSDTEHGRDNEKMRTRVGGDKEQRRHKIHAQNECTERAFWRSVQCSLRR